MSGNLKLKNLKRVAIDTNIFIYHFHDYDVFTPKSNEIFSLLTAQGTNIVTSSITIAELLSIKAPTRKINELKDELYQTPNLKIISVSDELAIEAARIRRDYSFRLPDAIQLATAVFARAEAFITNDKQLKRFKKVDVYIP